MMRRAGVAALLLLTPSSQVHAVRVKKDDLTPSSQVHAVRAKKKDADKICQKVAHISIPGTASSTLSEEIIPTMTKKYGQEQVAKYHMEYRWANALAPTCMVASLRDPVERVMSEFNGFRSPEGAQFVEQDLWDIHANDQAWAREVRANKNTTEALNEYVTSPANPTRNRQALYLLGFERVTCEQRCCGVCSHGNPGYPAKAYDWDANHDALLFEAKKRLASLNAFVIQDCFPETLETVADALGWDPEETDDLARNRVNARRNAMALTRMASGLGSGRVALDRRVLANVTQSVKWASVLPPGMADTIRKQNAVDVELVKFAKTLLYERTGIECGEAQE